MLRPIRLMSRRIALRFTPRSRLSPIDLFRRDGYGDLITSNLPLDGTSQVLDFGGYLGDWSAEILHRYGAQIHIFEPVEEFVAQLNCRFAGDNRISIHPFAIGLKEGVRHLHLNGDGTSAFSDGEIALVEFRTATSLVPLLPDTVDLASINIEGGEYELIPALAQAKLLERIDLIFIQFHRVSDESVTREQRETCRTLLTATHECLWAYDFVWEAWKQRQT